MADILVVDEFPPTPEHGGASLRMAGLLRALAELGWETSFTAELAGAGPSGGRAIDAAGATMVPADSLEDHLAASGHRYGAVLLSRANVAARWLHLVRRHAPEALLIYDTVDLHYLREYRQARAMNSALHLRHALARKRQELVLVAAADRTLVVSDAERAELASACPDADVHVVSNVHAAPGRSQPFEPRAGIMFVGHFAHHPNVDAVEFLLAEVWPRVSAGVPEARLFLVGGGFPDELRSRLPASAVATGYVDDLDALHDSCRISIAPLRFGAGVKGKVLESLGHGVPVVGTPVAFEGIPVENGRDALVAETADDLASATCAAYRDPGLWGRLSDGGADVVERHFSLDAARAALDEVLSPPVAGRLNA